MSQDVRNTRQIHRVNMKNRCRHQKDDKGQPVQPSQSAAKTAPSRSVHIHTLEENKAKNYFSFVKHRIASDSTTSRGWFSILLRRTFKYICNKI